MGTKQFDNYADLITFTRATGATYLDSDGVLKTASTNIPRIEYDADGNRLGLLIEEQRTNLLTYSEDFSDGAWVKTDTTVTTNTVIAPDGTLTGDHLAAGITSDYHGVTQNTSDSDNRTFSVFAKAAEYAFVRIGNTGKHQSFNLSTGQLGSINTGVVSSSIENFGNGWYRCTVSFSNNVGTNNYISFAGTDIDTQYTGDGTSGIYVWGAQLEAGSFPTSYIPTSGSTATRAADVASITGADFKKWFNPERGTLFIESTARTGSEVVPFMTIDNGATNKNEHRIMKVNTTVSGAGDRIVGLSRVNGTLTSICASSSAISGNFKASYGYKLNDFAASVNAAAAVTDASGVLPTTVDRLFIGTRATIDTSTNGHIKSIKYYPRRLSNAQLQELTQ